MTTSTMRLIYYNGTFWRTVQQADGTRHAAIPPGRPGADASRHRPLLSHAR